MTESNPTPSPQGPDPAKEQGQPPKDQAPAKVRRRRRWPWIVAGLFLLLVVLVLLAPTIAGMGWVRSIVVGQINQRINGRAEIKGWSLGWFSGTTIDGLVIYDESKRQILQLPHVATGLNVWGLIRGRYDLGHTTIDGLDVLVSREADGSLNWAHLAKTSPAPATSSAPPNNQGAKTGGVGVGAPPKAESKLPDIRGDLVLNNCSATYEDTSHGKQPLLIRPFQGEVKIPDINQTISDSLSARAQIGQAPPGEISLNGSLSAIRNNVVAMDTAGVDQTLKISALDLAAISNLLGMKLDLAGRTNGQVIVQLTNGKDGVVQASVKSTGFAAAGPQLNGGGMKADALTLSLPRTTLSFPKGASDLSAAKLQIGDGRTNGFVAQLTNVNVVQGSGAAARQVISGDTFTFDAAATYSASAHGRELNLGRLSCGDQQGVFSIQKSADQDVAVSLPASGSATGKGSIDIAADLKRLNDIARAFAAASQVTATDQAGTELRSGMLKGTIAVGQASEGMIAVNGNLGVTQLSVGNASATPIQNESVQVTFKATANHDLSQVEPQLQARGDLVSADVSDTRLNLSSGSGPNAAPVPVFQKIVKATVKIDIPSLPKIQVLMRAFSPAKPTAAPQPAKVALASAARTPPRGAIQAAAPQSTAAEAPPLDITNGSATVVLLANSDGQKLHLAPQITVASLTAKRGETSYGVGTITLKADSNVAASPAPTAAQSAPSPIDGPILATAQAAINDLTIDGQAYPERAIRVDSDIAFDQREKALELKNVTAQMTTTNALNLVIKGRVTDLGGQQKIDQQLTADLSYDAAGLWKLILPLMSKDSQQKMKDTQVAGHYQKQFVFTGAYPSGVTGAVQQLGAKGDVQLDLFDGQGVTLKQVDLPVVLQGGYLIIAYKDKPAGQNIPPPASFNGGTLSLGGCAVDLRGDHMRLTTPKGLPLVHGATLNPVFAAWSLGSILNNPLFVGAKQASGLLDVTLVDCNNLPLDSAISTAGDGNATFNIAIQGLHLGNQFLEKVAEVAQINLASLQGNVQSYQVTINQGITDHNLVMTVGENQRPLRLFGKVDMATRQMLPVTLDLPWKLFGLRGIDKSVQQFLPDGIQLPFRGRVDSPQLAADPNQLIGKLLAEASQKAVQQGLLGKLIPPQSGGGKGGATTQPAGSDNPLQQIEDLINATKKKKK